MNTTMNLSGDAKTGNTNQNKHLKVRWAIGIACVAILIGAAVALSGCAPTGSAPPAGTNLTNTIQFGGVTINPVTVGKDLRVAARMGAQYALQKDPNSKAYLQASYELITVAINSGQYDPAVLKQGLANISVKELNDPTIVSGIADAFDLFANHFPDLAAQANAQSAYIIPVLNGLRSGIGDALGIAQ